jgi:Plasmid pRiA4b ORF-3-like protein
VEATARSQPNESLRPPWHPSNCLRLERRTFASLPYSWRGLFTADWKLDIRLERALPLDPNRALPSCVGGSRAAPPEDCAGALDYLKRLDWHRSHLPIDELNIMVEAMRRFLDSDGDRHATGDLDELREAVDRVKAYQDLQPDKLDRRELNRRLRGIAPRS